MSDKISGTYYSAQPGLFPGLLPGIWFVTKRDGSVHFEMWGEENTRQAVAWLDARETERLVEVKRRGQD